MNKETLRTLIIIPAYNEEKNIPGLMEKIKELPYDYLLINDCSTDNSPVLMDELQLNHLDLPVNMGLARVTQIGFMYARDNDYDRAIVVDGDGQHPPVYIHTILDALNEGYDYVVGSRFVTEKKPWTLRMLGSRIICLFIKLKTGKSVTDPTSGMRAVGRKGIEAFADHMNYVAEPDALCHLLNRGYKVKEIQVNMEERTEGVSYFSFNPFNSIKFMLNVLISILFIQ
ncbi:MAG: glycosyltransferase family 2 protein [Erysipelotrichaceae bacterium]|nr:glycosyltransferase family 2 protein [Erysipelotrichaceae bacterium]